LRLEPRSDAPPSPEALFDADLALVREVLAGDKAAVDAFVDRMACVRRFLVFKNAGFGTPLGVHEVEDAVQSTLLAVWRKLDQYAGLGSLDAWATRFAFLELMNRRHRRQRRPEAGGLGPEDDMTPPAVPGEPTPDPLERERLYRGLERLEADAAEAAAVIRLKHLDERTFEEIAAQTGVPVNTVKTRYYRGMERLRQILRDPRTDPGASR